ncbi:MAG: heparinase II/III family protein [Runella sp.]
MKPSFFSCLCCQIMLLCLGFSINVLSQPFPRNILGQKYSLAEVKSKLIPFGQFKPYPKTPAEWQAQIPDSIRTRLVKAGEEALSYTFEPISATVSLDFVRSGDRERHSKISFGKRNALMDLVLAESIEDQGRFTEAILNGLWSICEESYWGVPAHIRGTGLPDVEDPIVDLFDAETASVVALTDYFVGEKLDKINPLIRKRIYYETNRRLFEPMLKNPNRYGWMSKTQPVNNWNPWIMSNWITATLLLEKDENRRAEMLHQAMLGMDLYLNGLGDDGGCDEGPSYWFAAGACVFDCLEWLEHASKGYIQIYNDPLIRKMASYVYKTHVSHDYFVNFADADPKLKPDGLMLYRFGQKINDPQLTAFGAWAYKTFPAAVSNGGFHRMRRVWNLLTIKSMQPTQPYQPTDDAWLADIQVLTARSAGGLFLATHGGHNAESHNHNDVGDFLVYANGEPVIIDAGRGNYTARTFSAQRYQLWFTQSENHNLPTINGIGQKAGRAYEAKNVSSTINDKEATLKMDIAPAYPKEAGIQTYNRTVKLNRLKNQVEIADEYWLEQKPSSLVHAFITVCTVDLASAGKISIQTTNGQRFILQYDPKIWEATLEQLSTDGPEYRSFKTKWDNRPVQRIVLKNKVLNQKGKYNFVLTSAAK